MNPTFISRGTPVLIEGRGLTLRDDEVDPRVRFDIRIVPGEIVAVVGAPESGTAALADRLSGVTRSAPGTVSVLGHDLSTLAEGDRDRLVRNLVGRFDGRGCIEPGATLIAHVATPLLCAGVDPTTASAWARHSLAGLGLSAFETAETRGVNDVVRRLVALARATVLAPAVLIAVEPTIGLDALGARRVMQALLEVASRPGRAVVIFTEEPTVAAAADRLVYLERAAVIPGGNWSEGIAG